jgi:hypothetical protein
MRNRAGRPAAVVTGLVALLVAAIGPAAADPALHTRYGDPATSLSAEIDAMAGTGTALYRGGFSNVLNPAMLTAGPDETRVDGALSLSQAHEDRFIPLFDTFTSYVVDTAIATNRHHYFGTGFALAQRLSTAGRPVTVALSLTDRYSFAYDFREQIRDPDSYASPRDAVLQERAVEIDGTLRALSGGAAVELGPRVSLGAAAHYAFGSRDQTRSVRDYDVPASSLLENSGFDMEGLNFTLGARIHVDERLELGLTYETPLEVTGHSLTETFYGAYPDSVHYASGSTAVVYPRAWRAGFAYRPRSAPRTVFTVDAAWREWSDLDDSRLAGDNPLLLDDALDVSIGIEHRFYNGLPVRFGFRRLDAYDDREVGASFFTAGVGLAAAGGTLSVSTELSKLTSVRDHWFAYPAGYVVERQARVEDTKFRLGVGWSRAF